MLCKDPRVLPAGGAAEMEIARQLSELARKETGLEQYAIAKFAEALEASGVLRSCHSLTAELRSTSPSQMLPVLSSMNWKAATVAERG